MECVYIIVKTIASAPFNNTLVPFPIIKLFGSFWSGFKSPHPENVNPFKFPSRGIAENIDETGSW